MEQVKISTKDKKSKKNINFKLISGLHNICEKDQACVATIGNFDGIHQGHRAVFNILQKKSVELGLISTVITFEPLPHEYFMGFAASQRIYPLRDKLRILASMGLDRMLCLRFNQDLASMEPEDFIRDILHQHLDVRYLVVGDDFRFGRQRRGDFDMLQRIGAEYGMDVHRMPTHQAEDERVSSTRVRKHLNAGEMDQVHELLGEPYLLSGRVRHGDKRGRTIGFPTLNLRMPSNLALKRGVYAVKVYDLEDHALEGVANVGHRPTVKGKENRLEVHVFDYDKEVYGRYIKVDIILHLRAEKRFESFQALKDQIQKDAEQARDIFRMEKKKGSF